MQIFVDRTNYCTFTKRIISTNHFSKVKRMPKRMQPPVKDHHMFLDVFLDYIRAFCSVLQISAAKNHKRIDRCSNLKWLLKSAKRKQEINLYT